MYENFTRQSVVINKEGNYADYKVPDVCIQCGEPATMKKEVVLRCQGAHWTIYVFILFIAEMLETKIYITLPLCEKHKNSMDGLTVTKLLLLIFVLPLIVASIIVFLTASSGRDPVGDRLIAAGVFTAGIAIGWILFKTVRKNKYYGVSIDDNRIKLAGVSPQFAKAFSNPQNSIHADSRESASEREYGQSISKPLIQEIIEKSGGEGEEIIIIDTCPACGTKVSEDNKHCPECGLTLS